MVPGNITALSLDCPAILAPVGLSHRRQQYLFFFEKIKPFMADDCSNIVCPKPVDSNPVDLASLAQTQTCFGFL